MAIFKIIDFAILFTSAAIAQIIMRSLIATAIIKGLRMYIPTSAENKGISGKKGKAVKLSQVDKYGPSLPGADTLLSVPITTSHFVNAPFYSVLEMLIYASLLVVLVSLLYPAAHAILGTASYSTPLLMTLAVIIVAAASLSSVDFFSLYTSPDDKVYTGMFAFVSLIASAIVFALEPKGASIFAWDPDAACSAFQQQLIKLTLSNPISNQDVSHLISSMTPTPTIARIMLCLLGAIFSALFFSPCLRFVRSYNLQTECPQWARETISPSKILSTRFQLQLTLPIFATISWIKPLFDDAFGFDSGTAALIRGVGSIIVGALFLYNSRTVVARYLDSTLIAWYTLKHSAKKSSNERTTAGIMILAKAEAVQRLLLKAAVQSIGPGVIFLSCGLSLVLVEYFAEQAMVVKPVVVAVSGYLISWLGACWFVYSSSLLWLFRTGTLTN